MTKSHSLISAARNLRDAVDRLSFAAPVTHVYNPLRYAWRAHETYLRRYGNNPKRVLFRGIGPELRAAGITGELQDPTLELHDENGTLLGANDDWKQANNAGEIQSSGAAPTDDKESAILTTLNPGNYTGVLRGANNSTGIGLIEGFKLNQ